VRIVLRCGGIIRQGPERDLIDDYLKRANGLTRTCGFQSLTEDQIDLKKEKNRSDQTRKLLNEIPSSTMRVLLDERGKTLTSRQMAASLEGFKTDGFTECQIIIGPADGFDPKLIQPGTAKWAFGVQTWPHKLIRVMLAEQVYRALSILASTPYHRD